MRAPAWRPGRWLPLRVAPAPHPDGSAQPNGSPRPPDSSSGPGDGGRTRGSGKPVRRMRGLLSRHWLFTCVLVPAIALRVLAMVGYQWQEWFNDSFHYVADAVDFHLDPSRTTGYSIFLKVLEPLHSYAAVTSIQHLMGLAVAVMVYALARQRFGAPAWVACLAAVPVLYDGFQIQLEHLIMADVPFEFLIMLAATIVLWQRRPSVARFAIAGALIGIADLVRSVGLPLLVVLLVYLIVQRAGWRALASAVAACAVPIVAYAGVFYAEHQQFALTGTDASGVYLYSRVMTFAECSKMPGLPADELELCTTTPPSKRPIAQDYIWRTYTPLERLPPPMFAPVPNKLAEKFATTAIEDQPLAYARTVWDDTWRVFGWDRHVFPNGATYDEYLFRTGPQDIPPLGVVGWSHHHSYASNTTIYARGDPQTKVVEPWAWFMQEYQKYVYLPGTVYGLILLVGAGGLVLAWRRIGGEALLPWLFSLALIVTPAATAEFDYRYVLPAVPFGCLAAAIAFGEGAPARTWLARRGAQASAAKALDNQGDLSQDTP